MARRRGEAQGREQRTFGSTTGHTGDRSRWGGQGAGIPTGDGTWKASVRAHGPRDGGGCAPGAVSLTHLFIRQVGLQTALLAGIAQEGGERPQAEVVMVLSGQLLHGQRVQRVYLLGQDLGSRNGAGGSIEHPRNPSPSRGTVTDTGSPALGPEAAGMRSVDNSSGKISGPVPTWVRGFTEGRPPSSERPRPHILPTTASVPHRIS